MPAESRAVAGQFLRFVAVGFTAAALDLAIHRVLVFVPVSSGGSVRDALTPSLGAQGSFFLLKVVSGFVATCWSFYWNRKWTFQATEGEAKGQFVRYATVVGIGLLLNAAITTGLNLLLPFSESLRWGVASAVAVVMVAFWNFTGHRLFSFRPAR